MEDLIDSPIACVFLSGKMHPTGEFLALCTVCADYPSWIAVGSAAFK